MINADQRLLFTSLGFLSVVMQGDDTMTNRAGRARTMASLIEEFCRWAVPDAFDEVMERTEDGYTPPRVDHLIETFKMTKVEDKEQFLPKERSLLLMMHKQLEERRCNKARQHYPTELLQKLVFQLIQEEAEEDGRCP